MPRTPPRRVNPRLYPKVPVFWIANAHQIEHSRRKQILGCGIIIIKTVVEI